jgi:hypothetical protein
MALQVQRRNPLLRAANDEARRKEAAEIPVHREPPCQKPQSFLKRSHSNAFAAIGIP